MPFRFIFFASGGNEGEKQKINSLDSGMRRNDEPRRRSAGGHMGGRHICLTLRGLSPITAIPAGALVGDAEMMAGEQSFLTHAPPRICRTP